MGFSVRNPDDLYEIVESLGFFAPDACTDCFEGMLGMTNRLCHPELAKWLRTRQKQSFWTQKHATRG